MRRFGHSERERHPNGEGPGSVGTHGFQGACGDPGGLGPPPGAPIRTAWIAGRIGLAFVDESMGVGALSTCPTGGPLDPVGVHDPAFFAGSPGHPHHIHSLTALEALDVSDRPFIWDL